MDGDSNPIERMVIEYVQALEFWEDVQRGPQPHWNADDYTRIQMLASNRLRTTSLDLAEHKDEIGEERYALLRKLGDDTSDRSNAETNQRMEHNAFVRKGSLPFFKRIFAKA